jgi:VWFA-related protein
MPLYTWKMIKLATALFAALLLLGTAGAQNTPQSTPSPAAELPSAPAAVQPHFPGAAARPAQSVSAQPVSGQTEPAAGSPLTNLPPADLPPAAAPAATPTAAPTHAAPAHNIAPETGLAPSQAKSLAEPPTAQAQSTATDESGLYRIGVEVDLVDLVFTATDKHGHFIKDLKQSDIRLLDQGKPPERIEAFESQSGLPLRVGLLIDASNSIRERFRFEQDAAVDFLNQVIRPKSDLAFVIGFDSTSDLTQDYTDNTTALAHGVQELRPGGGTALHDAIFDACAKLAKAPVRGAARRAIILLSDGDDNQSRHTREEAIAAALRAGVIIYVIDTSDSDSNGRGDKVLMRYADATGGRVFVPLHIEDVSDSFHEIQDELRSQYVLAYKPQDFVADGRYRPIAISAPKRGGVKIRARKGYYAPTPGQ